MKALELYAERYGDKFWKVYNEFDKLQWVSESEIEEYQLEKLKELVHYSYKYVPYYYEVMQDNKVHPDDIKELDDIKKLPVLTRDAVRNNYRKLLSVKYPSYLLRTGHTSGTTGSPLDFHYDIKTCVVHHAADWRQKNCAGLRYGDPYASIQGRVIVPFTQDNPPFWRENYINKQIFLSSFHLNEINLPYYFDKLQKGNIKFIEGYPSTLYILALYLNKGGESFPMRAVLTSSETLFDYQRKAIEKAFACKIFDFYGMAERVVFATQCSEHKGHHLNLDYGITEFLDSNGQPVERGQMGKLVATSLHNYAMPFIRYSTNDASSLMSEKCSCGRCFPLMDDIATKEESIITLPDGRLVSPSVLTHPFKPMHNILESQIIQEDIDQITVKVVKNQRYTKVDEEKLLSGFTERIGNQMKVRIEYVDSIPRTKNGKLKWVISKVKPAF